MKRLTYRSALYRQLAILSLAFGITLIPTTASATNVHISTPSFSIGFHDRHHDRHYRKKYKKHQSYRNHDYRYRRHDYYPRNYYPRNYKYNNYYYRPETRYYNRNYYRNSRTICPVAGYSSGYDERRNCYVHKDHFHCD